MACKFQQLDNHWDLCLLGTSYLQLRMLVGRLQGKDFHQFLVVLAWAHKYLASCNHWHQHFHHSACDLVGNEQGKQLGN